MSYSKEKQHEYYLKRKERSKKGSKDRPYTKDTIFLIKLYYARGESIHDIACVLDRSVENVQKALKGV